MQIRTPTSATSSSPSAGTATTPTYLLSANNDEPHVEQKPPSVLVIGGGFAGLAAARTLLQQQPGSHITVLECKDRLGGRVHSICLAADDNNDQQVWGDLGGMFWHGHSAVYQSLAQDFPHVESIASGGDSKIPAQDSATWLRYHSDDNDNANCARPHPVTDEEIERSQELYQEWESAMHKRYQEETSQTTNKISNVESETSRVLASWSSDFCAALTDPLDRELLQLRITMSFEMDRGMSWENHTFASLDQDWDWVDIVGDDVIARHGMQGWVNAISTDIQNMGGQLLLDHRVECIDYGSLGNKKRGGCTVTTEQGLIFQADYAIVALPLGVLKARADKLFCPPLPALKTDALDRAGVGVLNTLLIRWNRPLSFPGKSNAYYFLQSKHIDNPLRHGFCCPSHLRQGRGNSHNTVTQFHFSETNHPFDDIEYWKAQAVQIVQDVVEEPLSVCDIGVAHVSQWHLDSDILGSYSAATTRTRGNDDRMILGAPVGRRVFFAGEHTHTWGRYQSMDGAYETGVRAAHEIIQVLSGQINANQSIPITNGTQYLNTLVRAG
eukprot:scaffold5833_cov165-Amphora_coffeaeformis.AAC.29